MNDCAYYEEQISALLDHMLSEEEERALRAHLEQCDRCRVLYQELAALSGALFALRQEPPPDFAQEIGRKASAYKRRRASRRSFAAMAAVLVLAVLGAGGIGLMQGGTSWSAGSSNAKTAFQESGPVSQADVLLQGSPAPTASPVTAAPATDSSQPQNGGSGSAGSGGAHSSGQSGGAAGGARQKGDPAAAAPSNDIGDSVLMQAIPKAPAELAEAAEGGEKQGLTTAGPVLPPQGPFFAIVTVVVSANASNSDSDSPYLVLNREEFEALLETWKNQGVPYTLDTTGDQIDTGAGSGLVIYQKEETGG